MLWRVVLYKMETLTLSGDGKGRWGRYSGIHGSYRASEVMVKECRREGNSQSFISQPPGIYSPIIQ